MHLGNLLLMRVGNSIKNNNYGPDIVYIGNNQYKSKLPSQDITFKDIWETAPIYGIVGTIINEGILFCGGGTMYSCYDLMHRFFSTSKCQTFGLKDYILTPMDITMTEERTFAQSMMFDNNTWFIMGGQDAQGATSDTTEYLNMNKNLRNGFVSDSKMPEYFAGHCAKMINNSHLFTTGGFKNSSSELIFLNRG